MASKAKTAERQAAIEQLRADWLSPGDTVHTILRHVSQSGMSRSVSLIVHGDHEPEEITWLAARAMDDRVDQRRGGIKVAGCGMDMGFALVYNLGRTLYPDGFTCIGEHCRSNDHSNGDRDYSPHHHADGGYALKQRWL